MEGHTRRRVGRILLGRCHAIECRLPTVAPLSLSLRAKVEGHEERGGRYEVRDETRVLFSCTHHEGQNQMAEVLLRHNKEANTR